MDYQDRIEEIVADSRSRQEAESRVRHVFIDPLVARGDLEAVREVLSDLVPIMGRIWAAEVEDIAVTRAVEAELYMMRPESERRILPYTVLCEAAASSEFAREHLVEFDMKLMETYRRVRGQEPPYEEWTDVDGSTVHIPAYYPGDESVVRMAADEFLGLAASTW